MPLIKKVVWPWRDVTPFESPQELESCDPCVVLMCVSGVECIHCGLRCVFCFVFLGRRKWQKKKDDAWEMLFLVNSDANTAKQIGRKTSKGERDKK